MSAARQLTLYSFPSILEVTNQKKKSSPVFTSLAAFHLIYLTTSDFLGDLPVLISSLYHYQAGFPWWTLWLATLTPPNSQIAPTTIQVWSFILKTLQIIWFSERRILEWVLCLITFILPFRNTGQLPDFNTFLSEHILNYNLLFHIWTWKFV